MSVLNYANLDYKEFESLAKDVMEKILGIPMERFGDGKDGGVDLTEESGKRRIIVQCKRYLETGSTEAVRRLVKELPKVKEMDPQPKSYYIFTTATLLPQQVEYLRDCFYDYMDSDANIIYREKIEDFFNDPENVDVLRKHLGLVDSRPEWFKELDNRQKIRYTRAESNNGVNKLTIRAEELLKEILDHMNEEGHCDSDYWQQRFENLSWAEDVVLRSLFGELKEKKMISILWADNYPYVLWVLANGLLYFE